jgi:hypothetical protein
MAAAADAIVSATMDDLSERAEPRPDGVLLGPCKGRYADLLSEGVLTGHAGNTRWYARQERCGLILTHDPMCRNKCKYVFLSRTTGEVVVERRLLGVPSATAPAEATDRIALRELLDASFRRSTVHLVDTEFDSEALYIFLSATLLK